MFACIDFKQIKKTAKTVLIIAKDRQFSTEKDLKKKTLWRCPNTLRFFEKNRVKLSVKCNFIAFFGKK